MFKASYSKIKTGRRCQKAYQYKYVLKLRKRVKAKALNLGSLVHSCLESYFRNGHYLPVIRRWKQEEFDTMFEEERILQADVIPLTKELLRGYIKNWKESGMEMLWVEKDFEIEIADGIVLVGKIDGRARDSKKRQWLVEHKTCKRMPGEEIRIYDTQVILYDGVLPELKEKPVTGVMWDYLRTKLPTRPQVLKSGGLSTAKNIDTTPEVYLREVKRQGLDPVGYADILKDLELKRTNFFRQVHLPLSKGMSKRVREEVIITSRQLADLEERHSQGEDCFARNLTRDCSWCDYNTLCHAELRGEDTEYLLKHDYKVKEDADKEEVESDNED